MLTRILATLSLCLLMGCTTLSDLTLARRSSIDKEIAAARVEIESRLKVLNDTQMGLLKQVAAEHAAREQAAADYLFKGLATFGTLRSPTRPELVMGQSIQQTALQLPPASATTQAATLKALQTELDETKVTTEALKTQYEAELGKARAEGETKAKALTELDGKLKQVDADRIKALSEANTKEVALQAAKDAVQDKQLAITQKQRDDAKHNEKVKMWLMGVLLAAAAACGIGAAFLPIPALKIKLIVGAAICGGAAICVPFIEGWMVMVAIVICILGVAAWAINDYRHEHADATDTYRALNEVKQKATAEFKSVIAPLLDQWHTDPATTKRIDERLKQVGDT